ncbi:MAG: pentapeptide repeat-containing protein [Cytophagaceae bacterium]|nr:pentapeptide repeat-containing protein [Cytophagaceae bacterium]
MDSGTHENKTFEKIVYSGKEIRNREFEQCIFKDCDLSDSTFAHNRFTDCTFIGCNLSMMKLSGTSLRDVTFKHCKLLGINFSECEDFLFHVGFENCILDYASFTRKKMTKTKFIHTSLKQVAFANANLANAVFDDCDLADAVFNATDLKEADFRTANNYIIDPELNNIKKAKFSLHGVVGLLAKYAIRIE